MYTPDRQINPPDDYWTDDIKEQCEICYEYTTERHELKIPFKNIKQKVYVCQCCLENHEEEDDSN